MQPYVRTVGLSVSRQTSASCEAGARFDFAHRRWATPERSSGPTRYVRIFSAIKRVA
jgi:hypothetical protein